MEHKKITIYSPDERKEFIKILKNLDEKKQIGLNLMLEGLKILSEKQKKRH